MKRRFGLFPRYASLIIALVGSLLVASGAVGLVFSYRENQDHLVALQFEKAQAAATRIELYIGDIEQQVSWTALPGMDTGADPAEQRLIEYMKLQRQAPAITEATWIDAQGREQLRVSRLAMNRVGSGIDRATEPLFVQAMAGKVFHSPVSFRKETEPYMTISRRAGAGGGVTAVDVNLKFVWDVVSRIRIGESGLAYVVDDQGTLIAHPDISLVLKKTDLSRLPQVAAQIGPPATRAESGAAALEKARSPGGAPVLAAHARMPMLGWTVFVESPRSEAFAPLYATLWRMGLVLAAGLVLSVVASFFLARALVRPIHALQVGAARVGAGELGQRIDVRSGDELESLAQQFNEMAAALEASYADLERKVDERTRELSDALAQQTATAEVLSVISSSVADTRPVFEKIMDSCEHLFAADALCLLLVDDAQRLQLAAQRKFAPDELASMFPRPLQDSTTELALRQGGVLHYPDVPAAADLPAGTRRITERMGTRSMVVAPLQWDGRAIGSILVTRHRPLPFTDKELALVRTFADQAVIAIQNARLFSEIQDKSRQLEAANRHKSEFLANMSHELRTPLNAIIGFSEVLTEQIFGTLNDKQMEYLQDIHSSGQHLLSLINDVLDLSKIEAGKMELDLSCFDLGLLLEHSATLVRERAQRHGLTLELDVGAGLGEWVADARKIKQIVVNLLSNAVKFTANGGRVTVRARHLNGADGRPGDFAEVAVTDTGVGIAHADQALVFEEFRQAGGDVLRKAEGTGLGLALVKRFVELHGGSVALDSEPGRGSTFTITLPQHELEALR